MTNKDDLHGKIAIITGAGRGIGRAIAKRLSAAGAYVVLAARTVDQLDETRRLIVNSGGTAVAIPCDVSTVDGVEGLIAETMERFGRIDVLINNAGTAPLSTIEQMEPAVFDAIIATNVRAVYLCSRGVWPLMAATGGGAIINLSSVSAVDPFPGFAAYGAAKAFVNTYTKALAAEGRAVGIRVYGIAPGAVDTQMLRGTFPDFPDEKMLTPDDVAGLAELLLHPSSRYITGEVITIRRD